MTYYNECDPKAAAWLRELIAAGLIAPGDVDTRSITDVTPNDLSGFTQCHFFAGIGGWAHALKLAGWDDNRPVWTGSCPCQPFSQAGRGIGTADARHLWPVFERLIAKCSPPVVFGEQVASKAGRDWLAGVRADLEALGYAVGGADLCAAGVGAPHIRQRLYWVADADSKRHTRERVLLRAKEGERPSSSLLEVAGCGTASGVGNTNDPRPQGRNERGLCANELSAWASGVALPCTDGKSRRIEPGSFSMADGVSTAMDDLWNACLSEIKTEIETYATFTKTHPEEIMREMRKGINPTAFQRTAGGSDRLPEAALLFAALCELARKLGRVDHRQTPTISEEQKAVLRKVWESIPREVGVTCSPPGPGHAQQLAGKLRNAVRKLPPEAAQYFFNGFPLIGKTLGRLGLLRGYGNAIVPQVAAEFIRAFTD